MKRDVLVTSLVKQKTAQRPAVDRSVDALRRVEHLESQMAKLSELVREHAEDVDRLVRIVAEDRDVNSATAIAQASASKSGSASIFGLQFKVGLRLLGVAASATSDPIPREHIPQDLHLGFFQTASTCDHPEEARNRSGRNGFRPSRE